MSTTTAVEDEWVRRIGPEAAKARRLARTLRAWAWGLSPSALVIFAGAIAAGIAAVQQHDATSWLGGLVGLSVLATFVFIGAGSCGTMAGTFRFQAEASGLHALRAYAPSDTAYAVGRRMRSISVFDRWARERGIGIPDRSPLAEQPWSPDQTRAILPGWTSGVWFRAAPIGLGCAVLLWLSTGIMGGTRAVPHIIMAAVFGAGVICALLAATAAIAGLARTAVEYRHGYVTRVLRTRAGVILDRRIGADLVDPKTGFVIRPACAPPLDRATYDARISEIRAAHPDAIPNRLG